MGDLLGGSRKKRRDDVYMGAESTNRNASLLTAAVRLRSAAAWLHRKVIMIRSFADPETARLAAGVRSRKLPPTIQDKAVRLLRQMASVLDWNDLRSPPGNKLHALYGDRAGQYAIWINRQWRIAFVPDEDGALTNVEVTDYH